MRTALTCTRGYIGGREGNSINSVSNVLCDVLFLGDVKEESAPGVIVGGFTYTNCVDEKPNACTLTEESGPAEIKVLEEGHETGSATIKGLVKVVCSGISCKYSGENLKGSAKGPLLAKQKNGEVAIQEQTINKISGLLCPSTAKVDLTTTPLAEIYLAAAKMVCIFVGAGKGFYLTANGTECKDSHFPNRLGSYELGTALTDTPNEMVCARVGNARGLFLARRLWPNRDECKDSDAPNYEGEWELGDTQ